MGEIWEFIRECEHSSLGMPDYWDGMRAVWRRKSEQDAVSVLVRPGPFVQCVVSWDDSVADKHFECVCSTIAHLRLTLRRIANGLAYR